MRFFAITALLTALTAASPIVENVERGGYYPDPKTVTIKEVKAIGSGCPPGSFEKSLDDTKTTLTLAFSKYTVQTGKNIEPKEARKNCNVYLILDYPAGWSYTVSTSYLRGYADLDKTCKASVGAKYFWSGYPGSGNCKADIWGEKHDYDFDLEAKAAALVWSQCGKKGKGGPPFNINTSINVDCKGAYKSASAGIDSQDTKFEMKFPLTWKKC